MVNGTVLTIREEDLPERLHEAATAADVSPTELFEDRIQAISQWSQDVEDGDQRSAVAYAVEEVIRTADGIHTTGSDVDAEMVTDSADSKTASGRFDLRDETKTDK